MPKREKKQHTLFHPAHPYQIPMRLAAGAFILNSGLSKRTPSEEQLSGVHGMASGAYPTFKRIPPDQFVKLLSTSEILLGAALLVPVVPSVLAGAGLAAFSAGLLGLYLRIPGMRQEGSLRPTQSGIALAKDVWLLGIGVSLLAEEVGKTVSDRTWGSRGLGTLPPPRWSTPPTRVGEGPKRWPTRLPGAPAAACAAAPELRSPPPAPR